MSASLSKWHGNNFRARRERYNISEIVGHEDISRGRKIDPGPAFPLDQFREKILFGRQDDEIGSLETQNVGDKGIITADYLNIRHGASSQSATITDPLARGTKVTILETKRNWSYVKVDLEGWVSSKFVEIVR